jgi:hypothetical protein
LKIAQTSKRQGNKTEQCIGSGLGHQETADEHGPPAQPVDDNNATTSPSRAPQPLSFRDDASSQSVSTA